MFKINFIKQILRSWQELREKVDKSAGRLKTRSVQHPDVTGCDPYTR